MSKRVCAEHGCPTLVEPAVRGGRCDLHQRANDKARGTTTDRGYGSLHRRAARADKARINAGEVVLCWRCGEPILPGEPVDRGHDDDDRSVTRGPEHANRCNRAAAGRKSRPPQGG